MDDWLQEMLDANPDTLAVELIRGSADQATAYILCQPDDHLVVVLAAVHKLENLPVALESDCAGKAEKTAALVASMTAVLERPHEGSFDKLCDALLR